MASKEYEQIKDNLAVVMLPRNRAEFYAMQAPHEPMGDMALAYQILQDDGSRHLVTYEDLTRYHVSATQLHQDAFRSAEARDPAIVRTLEETLGLPRMRKGGVPPLYVVTNTNGAHGAAAILYPGMMERLSKRIGGDYAIIPSSVHEMMVVTTKGADLSKLEDLLHRVNHEQVAPQERLSDNVYCYDARSHIVMRASVYRQLQERESAVKEPPGAIDADRPSVRTSLQVQCKCRDKEPHTPHRREVR